MSRIVFERKQQDGSLTYSPPQSPLTSSSSPYITPGSSSSRISPALLLFIVILAAVVFISGLLHLLIRFLTRRPSTSIYDSNRYTESSDSHALQRQLQQLFRLHDSGLEQSLVDALPVFYYKEIIGLKEPFDCAVCLCEFSHNDKLRLLPTCSHAFHISCIDTWLLSNSTCPLCRGSLVNTDILAGPRAPNLDDSWRLPSAFPINVENSAHCGPKPTIDEEMDSQKRVFSVRLGKFRSLDEDGESKEIEETSSCCLDSRRCYSMGSYQYVEGDMDLQVALSTSGTHDARVVLKNGNVRGRQYRISSGDEEGKKISGRSRGESFSVSKIWLWSKNSRGPSFPNAHVVVAHQPAAVPNDGTIQEV
ncbi:hypothetical protein BT93_B0160 [Corymbia citriodora subsp. variegata]|nr:hypothetical protein BT93_B0160 [Corymbia citriodora subsp. variegata]